MLQTAVFRLPTAGYCRRIERLDIVHKLGAVAA